MKTTFTYTSKTYGNLALEVENDQEVLDQNGIASGFRVSLYRVNERFNKHWQIVQEYRKVSNEFELGAIMKMVDTEAYCMAWEICRTVEAMAQNGKHPEFYEAAQRVRDHMPLMPDPETRALSESYRSYYGSDLHREAHLRQMYLHYGKATVFCAVQQQLEVGTSTYEF